MPAWLAIVIVVAGAIALWEVSPFLSLGVAIWVLAIFWLAWTRTKPQEWRPERELGEYSVAREQAIRHDLGDEAAGRYREQHGLRP